MVVREIVVRLQNITFYFPLNKGKDLTLDFNIELSIKKSLEIPEEVKK